MNCLNIDLYAETPGSPAVGLQQLVPAHLRDAVALLPAAERRGHAQRQEAQHPVDGDLAPQHFRPAQRQRRRAHPEHLRHQRGHLRSLQEHGTAAAAGIPQRCGPPGESGAVLSVRAQGRRKALQTILGSLRADLPGPGAVEELPKREPPKGRDLRRERPAHYSRLLRQGLRGEHPYQPPVHDREEVREPGSGVPDLSLQSVIWCSQPSAEQGWSLWRMLDIKQKLAQMMERLKMYSDAILQYESLIGFYIGQLDDVSYSFGNFNHIHPFDFLNQKPFETVQRQLDSDDSQGTALDFIVLLEARVFSLYAHTGRLADGFDKILRLTHASTKVVEKYIDKNQPQDKELSVWKLGMCIWQLQNIFRSLKLFTAKSSESPAFQTKKTLVYQQLYQLIQHIGYHMYELDFGKLWRMDLYQQCVVLSDAVEGKQNSVITVLDTPNQVITSLMMTLQDQTLKKDLKSLSNYVEFYNQVAWDLVTVYQELRLDNLAMQVKFDLLRLKNVFPNLPFSSEYVNDIGQLDCQYLSHWKCLYGSILIQKLVYMHRESMQMSFRETFQEAMQVKEIPGSCFNNLFKLLSQVSSMLNKMKEQPYGYLEEFQLLERTDFEQFDFRIVVSRYLSVEAEGQLHVTLKAKGVGQERKKYKLISDDIKLEGSKKTNFILTQTIPHAKGGLYAISKVTFLTGKFKLYFVVNQKLTGQKINIHNPNLEVYPLEPTPGTDALLLNNLATSILVKLSEIPQSAKSLILEFSAPFNHHISLTSLESVALNVAQEKSTFTITSNDLIPMRISLLFRLTSFLAFDQPQNATLKIQILTNTVFIINKVQSFISEVACNYREIPLEHLEEGHRVFEVESPIKALVCIKAKQEMELQYKRIRMLVQQGEDLLIRQGRLSVDQIHTKIDSDVERKWFKGIEAQLEELINQPVDLIKLIEHRGQKQNKLAKKIFKISIHTIIPQESLIPFKHSQYYNILVKLQFQGEKSDEGHYSIRIEGVSDNKIQIKGKRVIYQRFTAEQTLLMHNYVAFFNCTSSFEQPELILNKHAMVNDLIDKDFGIQVDPQQIEIQFELRMSD